MKHTQLKKKYQKLFDWLAGVFMKGWPTEKELEWLIFLGLVLVEGF